MFSHVGDISLGSNKFPDFIKAVVKDKFKEKKVYNEKMKEVQMVDYQLTNKLNTNKDDEAKKVVSSKFIPIPR